MKYSPDLPYRSIARALATFCNCSRTASPTLSRTCAAMIAGAAAGSIAPECTPACTPAMHLSRLYLGHDLWWDGGLYGVAEVAESGLPTAPAAASARLDAAPDCRPVRTDRRQSAVIIEEVEAELGIVQILGEVAQREPPLTRTRRECGPEPRSTTDEVGVQFRLACADGMAWYAGQGLPPSCADGANRCSRQGRQLMAGVSGAESESLVPLLLARRATASP